MLSPDVQQPGCWTALQARLHASSRLGLWHLSSFSLSAASPTHSDCFFTSVSKDQPVSSCFEGFAPRCRLHRDKGHRAAVGSCLSGRPLMVTLHPSQPPLATIGRALTLVQVVFYLPVTLDIGGRDAFLALSAALASYYFGLSSLRLATRGTRLQWIGDLFAVFQFLVVPSCLAICWAVYCPPEQNYFFVRWARYAGVKTSNEAPLLHPATPPHLAAVLQAIGPIVRGKDTHPHLQVLYGLASRIFLFLARKVPGWWGTLLRFSGPVFSLLEGSATLLVIQVLGTGCRYIIATSLTRPNPPAPLGQRRSPLSLLSSIGLRGAEAWQLGFLLSSAIIYVISGWALYLAFDGVAARGGEAALMTGVSVSSVAWLTAIAFAIGKGNVVETALIVSTRVVFFANVLTYLSLLPLFV